MPGQEITQPARLRFAPEQVKMLKRTVARDCNDDEFVYFLEVCAAYNLDPLMKEVYAAKMPAKNGGPGRVVVIVGRDGYLKIARSRPGYKGIDGDVVRENDVFRVSRSAEGTRGIEHVYEGGTEKRGKIIGAWCEVFREGHRPYYAFAPIAEYRPTSENKLRATPWGAQESVMIQKCAYIIALRTAFGVTGIYDEAEMAKADITSTASEPEEIVEWGDDTDHEAAEFLRRLVGEANRLKPDTYRPAKLAMILNGKSAEERGEFAAEVARFIVANGGTVPEAPPLDAEVVG